VLTFSQSSLRRYTNAASAEASPARSISSSFNFGGDMLKGFEFSTFTWERSNPSTYVSWDNSLNSCVLNPKSNSLVSIPFFNQSYSLKPKKNICKKSFNQNTKKALHSWSYHYTNIQAYYTFINLLQYPKVLHNITLWKCLVPKTT